jgi:hypothetical protein
MGFARLSFQWHAACEGWDGGSGTPVHVPPILSSSRALAERHSPSARLVHSRLVHAEAVLAPAPIPPRCWLEMFFLAYVTHCVCLLPPSHRLWPGRNGGRAVAQSLRLYVAQAGATDVER